MMKAGGKQPTCGLADLPEQYRACQPRISRACRRYRLNAFLRPVSPSIAGRKRTGGNQHVTVKHIHQQVNVTEGGQAVVAGDTVTRGPGERRRGMIEK